MKYEYIALQFDLGDVAQLNRLASDGWRVVGMLPNGAATLLTCWALLERVLPEVE